MCIKLLYFGLTVGRGKLFKMPLSRCYSTHVFLQGVQTLGEEYTDIWVHSAHTGGVPSWRTGAALVLLPTLPSYMLARWGTYLPPTSRLTSLVRSVPALLETLSEINLAIFYFRGTYYNLAKRILGIRYVSLYCLALR